MKAAKERGGTRQVVPFDVLREQIAALGEAVELVLAEPDERAVHRLRTTTRRVEAELALFQLLAEEDAGFAVAAGVERKVQKLLNEVRKSAGRVRDADVQSAAIAAVDVEDGEAFEADSFEVEKAKLLRVLGRRRAEDAGRLAEGLEGHARKMGRQLGALLTVLAACKGRAVPAGRVGQLTERWFSGCRMDDLDGATDKELHAVRKAAKLARYVAESAGLKQLAGRFEAIQQAGGEWHDGLALAAVARKRLGRKAGLTGLFERREAAALRGFRALLGPEG